METKTEIPPMPQFAKARRVYDECIAKLEAANLLPPYSAYVFVYDTSVFFGATGYKTYEQAREAMRVLGIGQNVRKSVTEHSTELSGELEDGAIKIKVSCYQLPPTCKLEKIVKRVPKTKVVETEEYYEVEETKVVCGDKEESVGE